MSTPEIDKLIATNPGPTGVTVESADGKVFFLTDAQAKHAEIHPGPDYRAYAELVKRPPPVVPERCRALKKWLDRNDPNTVVWKEVAQAWLDCNGG